MIHQYIDHFIVLPFGTELKLMAALKGIWGHQFMQDLRIGSSCLKPGLDHELLGNHI